MSTTYHEHDDAELDARLAAAFSPVRHREVVPLHTEPTLHIDGYYPAHTGEQSLPWPACHGPCDQGRKLCPSPDACRRSDDEPRRMTRGEGWAVVALYAASAAIVVSLIVGLIYLARQ